MARAVTGTLATLVALLAAPPAFAGEIDARGFETHAPALETLGDGHRVREGRIGDPVALDADAERAAIGIVSGANPLLDALPRRRASVRADAPDDARHAKGWAEAWIADVGILLPGEFDRDGDGFYAGFELTLDVDTDASAGDVYAIVELIDFAGFVTLRHETAVFGVYGYSSADRYRVEVELFGDHAAGYRDLSIDLRDARDGRRLDRVSAHDFRSLASLPLEAERHRFADDDPYAGHRGEDRLHDGGAFVAGYAAAGGPLGTLSLFVLVLWRRIARGSDRRIERPGPRVRLRTFTGALL